MASSAALDLVISLKGNAEKQLGGLSKSLLNVGKTALGAGKLVAGAFAGVALGGAIAGVGALSAALVGGIADAREAAQVMAATENVIKSMGRTGAISADEIAQMSASLSAAEGKSLFGDSDIQAGQNMLLTFANINEVLPEATQAMVDMTQFMGGDMVGASTMLGKALDNPTQGLSALSRVGVSFSEQQKEQIKIMQEAGDMAGAQGVILDALKSQFGGAALAAAQADGGWAQFRDRMGEIAEGVGAKLLPALNLIPQALNSPGVQAAIQGFADGFATVIGGAISWIAETGVPMFVGAVSGIATAINDWVIVPARNVIAAFNEWKAFGTEWGIVAALQEIGNTFPVLQPLTDWLANQAPGLVQGVREAFGLARDAFITFRDALAGEWHADPEKIHPLHLAVGEFGLMIRNEAIPKLQEFIRYLQQEAPKAFKDFRQSIQEDVIPALQWVSDKLGKQGTEDLPKAGNDWETFNIRASAAMNNFSDAVLKAGESAGRGLEMMVLDGMRYFSEFSIIMAGWVMDIGFNIVQVAAWFGTLKNDVTGSIDIIKLLFTAGWETAQNAIRGVFITIGGYISGPIVTAQSAISTAITAIASIIQGAIDKVNALIRLINSIPAVPNIPTIPSAPPGSSGFKALGGPVSAFTPYIVGERGPELFMPGHSGSIVPNNKLGNTNNVTINIYPVNRADAELGVRDALVAGGLL